MLASSGRSERGLCASSTKQYQSRPGNWPYDYASSLTVSPNATEVNSDAVAKKPDPDLRERRCLLLPRKRTFALDHRCPLCANSDVSATENYLGFPLNRKAKPVVHDQKQGGSTDITRCAFISRFALHKPAQTHPEATGQTNCTKSRQGNWRFRNSLTASRT